MNLHAIKETFFNVVIYRSSFSTSLVLYKYYQKREHQNQANLNFNRNISLFYMNW